MQSKAGVCMSAITERFIKVGVSESTKQGKSVDVMKGNALVYVLIVVMMLSFMLTVSLNISGYERVVTKSYRNYENLYDLAVSGVEAVVEIFNNTLEESNDFIKSKHNFEFDFEIEDGDAFKIEVVITPDGASVPIVCNVISTAVKKADGAKASVSATVECSVNQNYYISGLTAKYR